MDKYPGITRLHVGLGNECNHRCKMCFIKDYDVKLKPEIWKDRLTPLYPQLYEIMMAGGEPTFIDYTKDFVNHVIKVNPKMKFSIFTNGHLFDDWWIKLMSERGTWVNFSINAACKETYLKINKGGDWEILLENIKRFKSVLGIYPKLKLQSSLVITEDNYMELSDFIKFSADIGMTHVGVFFDHFVKEVKIDSSVTDKAIEEASKHPKLYVWGLERFKTYYENIERPGYKCETINYNLYVDIYGYVRYCCLIIHPDGIMGNLYKESLEDILASEKAMKIREQIKNGDWSLCSAYCTPINKEVPRAI